MPAVIPPLDLLDAALRGALLVLLALVGLRLRRDQAAARAPALRLAPWLMAGLAVQTWAALPWMERQHPSPWLAPLVAVSVGNSALFWLLARAMFDDDFVLRRRHAALWAAVAGLGALFYAVVVLPQQRLLAPGPLAVAVAMRWVPLAFAGLALGATLRHWREDLVEGRRRLRLVVVLGGSVYTVTTGLARLASDDGRLSPAAALLDVAMLVALLGLMAVRLLALRDGALQALLPAAAPPAQAESPATPAPAQQPSPTARAAPPSDPPPPDPRLVAELQRLMADERLYRSDDLGPAQLARRLGLPEYRLRQLINQGLGHRNFTAFVNGWRLAEVRAALADPARQGEAILAIALEAGFQSIGPFNRAFKADTGLTPSEFRRQALGGTPAQECGPPGTPADSGLADS